MPDPKREIQRVEMPYPERPELSWRPPHQDRGFGDPRRILVVSYTHVEAYGGELWSCDVCGAAIVKWPEDHPFVSVKGDHIDPFERHAEWHRALVTLEERR